MMSKYPAVWSGVIALMTSENLYAQPQSYDWGWGDHPMMWGAWGFGMMIMMILFWALIIVAVVMGIRWLIGQGKAPSSDTALEILRQRFARGEINQEEFDSKKKHLLS